MGGLDNMPPDIGEIDADIHKISALTSDSFMQFGGNSELIYSPRSQNAGGAIQQQYSQYGQEM